MFGKLLKAAVGVVDVVTMGGALTDKNQPYTKDALEKAVKNVQDSTE